MRPQHRTPQRTASKHLASPLPFSRCHSPSRRIQPIRTLPTGLHLRLLHLAHPHGAAALRKAAILGLHLLPRPLSGSVLHLQALAYQPTDTIFIPPIPVAPPLPTDPQSTKLHAPLPTTLQAIQSTFASRLQTSARSSYSPTLCFVHSRCRRDRCIILHVPETWRDELR
jgi:hypothetical protein